MNSESVSQTRRSVLKATGSVLATGAIAGCSSSGDSDSGGNDGGGGDGGSGTESFDGWMENVDNYDGVVDETGSSEVTVDVGAEGNGGNLAFGPAAIRVDAGTNVVWEWTGEGGSHNVVHDGGDFESELTDEDGFTFEQTFDSAGTVKYACTPHETVGMKGVVVVE